MKFDTPATTNPIDQLKVVGKPIDRIDGPLKTTGTAPYAYERHDVVPNQAYGYVVGSAIAKGRIASIDLAAAKAAPGVLAIVTAENAGKLGKGNFNTAKLLGGPEIEHYHQAIALVVAETFEQARAAAQLVRVDYATAEGAFDLAAAKDSARARAAASAARRHGRRRLRRRVRRGAGPARRDLHHARPVACDDGAACLDRRLERRQAHALDLEPDDRLERGRPGQDARHPEGERPPRSRPSSAAASAASCSLRADALLAALGARAAGRPVKVALHAAADDQQHHAPAGDHPAHPHRRDRGRQDHRHRPRELVGRPAGRQARDRGQQTRLLYAGANRMTATRLAVLDLPEGNAMRAPGEAPGMMALEIAMDEMAEKLGLDPDRVPHPQRHAGRSREARSGRSRSASSSNACALGAERFGWSKRNAEPGKTRDGRWLVGMGVAAAFRNNPS